MIALIMMMGWAAVAPAAGPPGPERLAADDVLVTAVSSRPPMSGVLRTFVILDVRRSGNADRLYQPFMRLDQFVPAAGDRCSVIFHQEPFDRAPGDPTRRNVTIRIVDEMSCGAGRFSMREIGGPGGVRP